MQKLILTDLDETIIEFARPFQDWLRDCKGLGGEGELRDNYQIEEWLDVDQQTAIDLMTEFVQGDVSYLNRPEPDALAVLPRLRREGYRFVGITACGICPEYAGRRIKIIHDVFGFMFEGIHYVDYRATKKDILDSFKPAIWVEDNYRHACDGALLGHETFLLDRPYNRLGQPSSKRVVGLDQLGETLRGDEFWSRYTLSPRRVENWFQIYESLNG